MPFLSRACHGNGAGRWPLKFLEKKMKKLLTAALLTAAMTTPALAAPDFNTEEGRRLFFLENAEYVLEAGKLAAQRDQALRTLAFLRANKTVLPAGMTSAMVNPEGKRGLTLVTDPLCSACNGYLEEVKRAFPGERIELVFWSGGEQALTAAAWAAAAYRADPEKFAAFYGLLEKNREKLAEKIDGIGELAKKAGYEKLTPDRKKDDKIASAVMEWAAGEGFRGTPVLIFADGGYVPGRMPGATLSFLREMRGSDGDGKDIVKKYFPAK